MVFDQISGYHDLAELTHKVNPYKCSKLSRFSIVKDELCLFFSFPYDGEAFSWPYWSIALCLGITNSTRNAGLALSRLTTPDAGIVGVHPEQPAIWGFVLQTTHTCFNVLYLSSWTSLNWAAKLCRGHTIRNYIYVLIQPMVTSSCPSQSWVLRIPQGADSSGLLKSSKGRVGEGERVMSSIEAVSWNRST